MCSTTNHWEVKTLKPLALPHPPITLSVKEKQKKEKGEIKVPTQSFYFCFLVCVWRPDGLGRWAGTRYRRLCVDMYCLTSPAALWGHPHPTPHPALSSVPGVPSVGLCALCLVDSWSTSALHLEKVYKINERVRQKRAKPNVNSLRTF